MKNLVIAIAVTLLSLTGFATINSAELKAPVSIASVDDYNDGTYILFKVYEDGAIWVYVYEEDGTFVAKVIDLQD
jgi:hypothetical protein